MKLPAKLSSKFSVEKAHTTQLQLSKKVICKDEVPKVLRYVAGVDVAYTKKFSVGAVTVHKFTSLSLVESHTAFCETRFPYIPTLLSFRELPPAVMAIKKLQTQPDIFLVDAHGIAHPYRLGFASHLGLVIDKPIIGVAKNLLCGKPNLSQSGEWMPVKDGEETIGAVVATKASVKPVYVSVGHKVSLERAVAIVKHCTLNHRIPEPIRKAHIIANKEKRRLKE